MWSDGFFQLPSNLFVTPHFNSVARILLAFKSNSPFKSEQSVDILPRHLSSKNTGVVRSVHVIFC